MYKTLFFLILSIFILLFLNNCSDDNSPTEFETAKFLSFIAANDSVQKGDSLCMIINYSNYSEIANAQIYIDEHLFKDSLNQKDTVYWHTNKAKLGGHNIIAKLFDKSNNVDYNERIIYLTGINILPTIKCSLPEEIDRGTIVDFNIIANDSDGYVAKIDLFIDEDLVQTQNNDTTLFYKWHTANIAIGSHAIKCKVTDNEDSTSIYETNITVNNVLPTCEIISPADSSKFDRGEIVGITAIVSDTFKEKIRNEKSITQVVFYDGETPIDTLTEEPFQALWQTNVATSLGQHSLYVKAIDNDAGEQISDPISVFINNVLPTCEIVSPADSSKFEIGDLVDIEILASDDDGSIEKVVLVINDISIDTVFVPPYNFSYETAELDTGWYQIKSVAYDNDTKITEDSIKVYLNEIIIPKN